MNIKHLFFLAFFLLIWNGIKAQKEDNTWLLGGNFGSPDSAYRACRVDFTNDTFSISFINLDLPYDITNSTISDSSGNLVCLSNGETLYNGIYEIMEGGSNFYPNSEYEGGVPYLQGYIVLPSPKGNSTVIHIYGAPKVVIPPSGATLGYTKLQYAIADMNQNGGLGKVIQRNITVSTDTLMPTQINAIRHGNGRDWWLLAPHYLGHRFFRFLLTPDGLSQEGDQNISATDLGLGHTCFSPDGQWYARFNWHGIIPDSSFATIELYRFDRCSGLLSDRVFKTYDLSGLNGKPGGVAFSPSSRFLYVTRWDSIFQYDLEAPDFAASEQVVAVYDGFLGDLGLPTRFFYPLLAPDNKIYICVSNYNSPYLHSIEKPDLPGLACSVQQHSVRLPVFNNFLLPNMPYYRLWEWEDAPCDTIGTVAVKVPTEAGKGFEIFPNPANESVQISLVNTSSKNCRVYLYSITGSLLSTQAFEDGNSILNIGLDRYENGCYFIQLENDKQKFTPQKIMVIHE